MATSLTTLATLMAPTFIRSSSSSLVSLPQIVRMNHRNMLTLCAITTSASPSTPFSPSPSPSSSSSSSFPHHPTSRWASQYKPKGNSLLDEIEGTIHDTTPTNQNSRKLPFSEVLGDRERTNRSRGGGGRDVYGGRGGYGGRDSFRERGGRDNFRGKEGRSSSFAREFKVDRKTESIDLWSDRRSSRPHRGGNNYNNNNYNDDFGKGRHGRRSSSSSSSYDDEMEFDIPETPSLPHPLAPRASVLFEDLPLSQSLLSLLRQKGFTNPTPIQAAAIPPALEGKDIIAQAHTGTGKTVAFVLPILQHLAKKRHTDNPDMDIDSALERFRVLSRGRNRPIEALIIAPTRELAVQIGQVFRMFGAHASCAVGGQSPIPQLRDIERGGILVGTPGRLLDFHRGGKLNLGSVQYLVLDEVDRMLDMGFLPDIENICSAVSPKRQTMLFSATLPPSIQEIALRHSYEPLEINAVGDARVVETVKQSVVMTRGEEKLNVLLDLFKWIFEHRDARILIFTNTKIYADRLTEVLTELGHPAHALHGDLRFHTRQMNLNRFKTGEVRILVATDVASRGLDIKGVTHVINFDVTNTPDDYVHRIGRTGRAGASGMAITLVASDKVVEKKRLSEIETMVGSRLPKFNKKLLEPSNETPIVL